MDEGTLTLNYPDGNIEIFKLPNNLTIIGTTTEIDKIPPPMLNRFTLQLKLKPYTQSEMISILRLHLDKQLNIDNDAYTTLANATRYVPRMAVQYASQIINYAMLKDVNVLTKSDVVNALHSWGIDQHGLTDDDREYISLIYNTFNNNPTGIKQLCAMLGDSEANIVNREIYLVKEGIIIRSSRGRMLTAKGLMLAIESSN